METEAVIKVRYAETDQMGVVYYANYYIWFEVGRTDYLTKMGYTYRKLEEEGIFLPVTESNCQYKSSAYYDDVLTIKTRVTKMKGARLVFVYQVFRGEDLLATGSTVHAFVDREGRLIKIKKNSLLAEIFPEERFGE